MRRLRANTFTRGSGSRKQLDGKMIYPMFVLEGKNQREAISSMPGIERLSVICW